MAQRAQTYWKRPRSDGEAPAERITIALDLSAHDGAPRGRRKRTHFSEHVESTRDALGFTADDDFAIERSRDIILDHADEIVGAVYRALLSHPEMALYVAQADGRAIAASGDAPGETLRDWLRGILDGDRDAQTADYLAAVAHAQVRPRSGSGRSVRGRFLLITMSQMQAVIVSQLAVEIADPVELASCATAWTKRLMVHLDLMLAVYSATQHSSHWY